MAFRSGYYRVQNASIITEKKHFPFQQRNQQPRSTRLEKKKKKKWSYRKTNKYSAQFQEVSRGSNKPLSIEVVGGTFMLTSALVPIYAAGFYTSTSGGHSNFRLFTKYLQKRKPRNPTPSVGEGKHSNLNLLPNHQLCPPGEDISKTGERNSAERGWERFSWCEHACEENAFSCVWNQETGSISGAHVKVSTQKEPGCFLLVPGEEALVHSRMLKQAVFQNKGGTTPTLCKQYSCFINLFLFSS